jgi:hypothetical protein
VFKTGPAVGAGAQPYATIQPGVIESSSNPFNLLELTLEMIVDEPQP